MKLIAAFADLTANVRERDLVSEMLKGLLPCLGVQIDGIEQRAVNIENNRVYHQFSILTTVV